MNEIETRIIEIINKLRPYMQNDGGDIEFVKYEDGKVYVKVYGACSNCSLLENTLKDGVEAALISEIPEVIEVININ